MLATPAQQQQEPAKPPSASKTPSQNACLPCRSVKMKCRMEPSKPACERCLRKSLNCVFEQHRRGRKPGTRLKNRPPKGPPPASGEPWQPPPPSREESAATKLKPPPTRPISSSDSAATYDSSQLNGPTVAPNPPPPPPPPPSLATSESWEISDRLQPAELLNKEARAGKFSLKNVLSVPDPPNPGDPDSNGHEKQMSSMKKSFSQDDPIMRDILSYPVALGLFDSFMRCLNPYICHFDAKLHTFEYIRQRSAFLLSVILAGASKAFHPPLHARLRAHAEELLGKTFLSGDKSVEVVQAIMVFTYWKDPDDTRTWLLIGYAIRICIELGWHELKPLPPGPSDESEEIAIREARNVQRTWLVLFVYDRSLSSQMGKPWMIELSDLIRSADIWHRGQFAIPGIDLLLSSFVRLRIIGCEILELAYPTRSSLKPQRAQTLLKLLNADITRWEGDWFPQFDEDGVAPCQRFLVRFYGLHLRLLLNSFSLQDSLSHAKDGLPITQNSLWTCYSSALGMLEQISEFGPLKLLYFAQDSVHVMTAYAAIFLIKLLLSSPGSLRTEFEASSIAALRSAANTFNDQCASPRTGCALQARFLANVVEKYESIKYQALAAKGSREGGLPDAQAPLRPVLPGQPSLHPHQSMHDPNAVAMMGGPPILNDANAAGLTGNGPLPGNLGAAIAAAGIGNFNEATTQQPLQPQDMTGFQVDFGNSIFADDSMWETLFANAGFRINGGVFMPDNIDGLIS